MLQQECWLYTSLLTKLCNHTPNQVARNWLTTYPQTLHRNGHDSLNFTLLHIAQARTWWVHCTMISCQTHSMITAPSPVKKRTWSVICTLATPTYSFPRLRRQRWHCPDKAIWYFCLDVHSNCPFPFTPTCTRT